MGSVLGIGPFEDVCTWYRYWKSGYRCIPSFTSDLKLLGNTKVLNFSAFYCRLLTASRFAWMKLGSLVVDVQVARSMALGLGDFSEEAGEVGVAIWTVRAGNAMWFLSHLLRRALFFCGMCFKLVLFVFIGLFVTFLWSSRFVFRRIWRRIRAKKLHRQKLR